jgi:VanZ family protein
VTGARNTPVISISAVAPFAPVVLNVICAAVLAITLTLGLWPFHSPSNQVAWLPQRNGISLGNSATLLSDGNLSTISSESGAVSLEIWAQPHPWLRSATLLALYDRPDQLRIRQSSTALRVQFDLRNESSFGGFAKLEVGETFRRAKPAFISITSGARGTTVYVDGLLSNQNPALRIPKNLLEGRLILGDSAIDPDSWRGQIFGLALYQSELSQQQTARHFNTWTRSGTPELDPQERNIALYLFDEHAGDVVHNRVQHRLDLNIPPSYLVVDKIFLEPFWHEFRMTGSYWTAVLKNIVGFIPLGFCVYSSLLVHRVNRPALVTLAFGTFVSITIELLQWFLPTRDSGTTDIFTNALGTWAGVQLHVWIAPRLANRFPWLGSLGAC